MRETVCFPAAIYLLEVNNRNTRTMWEICSKLTIKTPLNKSLEPYRSSHRGCPIKDGVPRNFTKFTGKHLCQSLFFNKVAGLRPY